MMLFRFFTLVTSSRPSASSAFCFSSLTVRSARKSFDGKTDSKAEIWRIAQEANKANDV